MKTIYLGVGHGGKDPGAVNRSRRESDDNLRLATAVAKEITAQGHKAILSRTTDIYMTPEQRRNAAIAAKADILIDIHRNSFTNTTANGIEIWIRNSAHTMAATTVLEELSKIEHQANRGIKVGAYMVLYNTPMPSMLLELGFISNTKDNELYDKHFNTNAKAIAKGLLLALGETWKEDSGEVVNADSLIRVQFGAFKNEANARALIAEMSAKGYECFPVFPQAVEREEG